MLNELNKKSENIVAEWIRKNVEFQNSFITKVLSDLGLVNGTETHQELLEIFKSHKVTQLTRQHLNPHPDAFFKFTHTFLGIQVDGVDYLYENYGK